MDKGYIYNSEVLNNIISNNQGIEQKEYTSNLLTWLENLIPENARSNFYQNVKTLKTNLNTTINLEANESTLGRSTTGGYNTVDNSLTMNENSLRQLWSVAKSSNDPKNFYWTHYSQTLLHELAHMASSNYNPESEIALSGFDKYPSELEDDKNRGLTEGFTEIISMAGVPGTVEIASGYYIEASLVNQMMQLVGNEVFLESYFNNLGTKKINEKLNEIIADPNMSSNLFHNIETNYELRSENKEQNVLGNIQSTLLSYLDKKVEQLKSENRLDEINTLMSNYESFLIDKNKLAAMKKNPENYKGVEESINSFNELKEKYIELSPTR